MGVTTAPGARCNECNKLFERLDKDLLCARCAPKVARRNERELARKIARRMRKRKS